MIDRCGRNIDYLRISVTDRCNLRCIYCMPEEGVQHVERSLILQEEEILRICRVMAELGIRKIKLTGGEPLVRPRMPQLVEKLKNMPGIEKVTLTTNGVLLKDQMSDFARAGLDGLNISLDTLDEACSRRITDRCNLRCIYCMPEEGVQHVERSLILQEEEILRICRVMAELGIRKIKLTGGEPLVRPRMPQLVEKLKNMPGIEKVTLTTNGVLLKDQMSDFARAGLDGLNISLDTLDEACSRRITRRDELGRTLEGISEAMKYPEISLKINCVPLGIPEQDLCRVALFARDHRVHVRFIEMMPIGMGKEFHGVSEVELLRILGEKLPRFSPYVGEPLGNGPCHYYDVDGFSGKIGFISAVSHKFCGECNRIRLTSQGFLKTCLQYAAGRDLREVIRSGGSDEVLKVVILEALAEKPDGHAFGGGLEKQKDDKTEKLCMAQIGG